MDRFLKQKRFAIVGSFRNETKYAYQIFRTLKEKGYDVIPVNPKLKEVDGIACYPAISKIPHKIDVVDIVTPPAVTEKMVYECKKKEVQRIWMQPGAESEAAIKFCQENKINVIYNFCLMAELNG